MRYDWSEKKFFRIGVSKTLELYFWPSVSGFAAHWRKIRWTQQTAPQSAWWTGLYNASNSPTYTLSSVREQFETDQPWDHWMTCSTAWPKLLMFIPNKMLLLAAGKRKSHQLLPLRITLSLNSSPISIDWKSRCRILTRVYVEPLLCYFSRQ